MVPAKRLPHAMQVRWIIKYKTFFSIQQQIYSFLQGFCCKYRLNLNMLLGITIFFLFGKIHYPAYNLRGKIVDGPFLASS